jgi:hypothetical protein
MITDEVVVIIGAGASKPYGFPTGYTLFRELPSVIRDITNVDDWRALAVHPQASRNIQENAKEFAEAISGLKSQSIDEYLNKNTRFDEIGRVAIAGCIQYYEERCTFNVRAGETDDWLEILFSKMIQGIYSESDFDMFETKNNIHFITFNYDRLLEEFFYRNLKKTFSTMSHERIVKAVERFKPLHIYGQAGYLDWEATDRVTAGQIIPFGQTEEFKYNIAERASKAIQTMYRERAASETIQKARDLVQHKKGILFIGFGYDKFNLDLLGFPILHSEHSIHGTAWGLLEEEISRIAGNISLPNGSYVSDRLLPKSDCSNLLRRFL